MRLTPRKTGLPLLGSVIATLLEPREEGPIEVERARLAEPFDAIFRRDAVKAQPLQLATKPRTEDPPLLAQLSKVSQRFDLLLERAVERDLANPSGDIPREARHVFLRLRRDLHEEDVIGLRVDDELA